MSLLTNLFNDSNKKYRKHKLYVHCHLYELINNFYKLDVKAEKMAKCIIKCPSEEDIEASRKKFEASTDFDKDLLDWHKKHILHELDQYDYGSLGSRIKETLDL